MNICFVYDCEYPWDIRVEKICDSLIENGYRIHLICRNNNAFPEYSKINELNIYRLPKFSRSIFTKISNITLFFNPFWLHKIHKIVKNFQCRLIIVRDLPLALTGIIIAKLCSIPLIVDMAEPYPLTVRQRRQYEHFSLIHIITRNILFADILEKITIKTADHIFVVCKEAKDRLIKLGAERNNVSIVKNTPDLKKFNYLPPSFPGIMRKIKGSFIVLYVGIIIGGRGIDLAIKAFREIVKEKSDIKLVIVGNGKQEKEMRALVQRYNLNDTVFFTGWIDNSKVPEYISSCDLGLLPFVNSQHINHTIANKLFDFMAMGKPVLCSNVAPMRRIIKETKTGYLFDVDNYICLKNRIIKIKKDLTLSEKGLAGKEFVKRVYNWEKDKSNILTVLEIYFGL